MDTLTIRQKLQEYIQEADDETVQAMYSGIAKPREWWNDDELVAELERRSADLKSGKDKGVPWEEVKSKLLSRVHRK